MKKLLLGLVLLASATVMIQAQKYGYVNSAELLQGLPEIKTADSELESYQKQLLSKGEAMVKSFETKYQQYASEAQSGTVTPKQVQEKETELASEQQKIQQYELEVSQKIAKKREELYQPIFNKVQNVIKQVGEEQGYTMIFDTSSGALLHTKAEDNLMTTIKGRL